MEGLGCFVILFYVFVLCFVCFWAFKFYMVFYFKKGNNNKTNANSKKQKVIQS